MSSAGKSPVKPAVEPPGARRIRLAPASAGAASAVRSANSALAPCKSRRRPLRWARGGKACLRASGLLSGVLLGLAWPDTGLAWSSSSRFSEAALASGGGGRFFTGSVADPYTCEVCHEPAGELSLLLVLPETYEPGLTYTIEMIWSSELHHVAANLEVVDGEGRPAGTLIVPDAEADGAPDAALCPESTVSATALYETEQQELDADGAMTSQTRQIVTVDGCGASMMYAQWVAPTEAVDQVRFVGAAVAGDTLDETEQADADGDQVAVVSFAVAAEGAPQTVDTAANNALQFGCSAGGMSESRVASWLWIPGLLLLAGYARAGARRLRRVSK